MPFYRAEYIDKKKEKEFLQEIYRIPTDREAEEIRRKLRQIEESNEHSES